VDSGIQAIIECLDDEARSQRVVSNLLADWELLEQVYRCAANEDGVPRVLEQALVEREIPALVERFAAVADLEEGMWLLPKIEEILTDFAGEGRTHLDALARRCADARDAGELAVVLGDTFGFAGDLVDYHDPRNSFLPDILERRCGLPITLVGLWMLVARRLGMAAEAIALPGHVYGVWEEGYVDCFAGGEVLDRVALGQRARVHGTSDIRPYLEPASTPNLLQRMCLNLAVTYRQEGDVMRCNLAVLLGQAL